ncbi:MAG: hypothetical protein RLZZ244_3111 [Verrucomicrobiota bacterium]|jgi:uncharacterized protein YjhX (UPF0386 family)
MSQSISLKTAVQLGVVPTHLKFVGSIVPNADGRFPRNSQGVLETLAGMQELCALSPVRISCIQVPYFASANQEEVQELILGLKALGLDIHFIIMVGGANPMDPKDEDAVVQQLVASLRAAVTHGVQHVSSTSIEEWMSAKESPREGAAFEAAIAQNVKVHLRAFQEAGLANSCVQNWHIEFLRPGEFKTFTSVARGWAFVRAANQALGRKFFKLLVDAAHCGDSGVSITENAQLIADLAQSDELGIFHASAKTTRGCLSTDDGWIGALLTAAAKTGKLEHVFVEVFHHEDPALELLRKLDSGHGIDTRDGRSYAQVTAEGLGDVAHRLNNLKARGFLQA